MNCTILLHSTTGNTRLVAHYAAGVLAAAGHGCTVHDIAKDREPPDLRDCDLLAVACPTMYWRPTVAMERFVARLPAASPGLRPAFLLATAGGKIGSHFALLAEQLRHKDYVTLGGHWLAAPQNYPPMRSLVRWAQPAASVGVPLTAWLPAPLRNAAMTLWPDHKVANPKARSRLAQFVLDMAERAAAGRLAEAPSPDALSSGDFFADLMGRFMTVEKMRATTKPRIDAARCTKCGTCVSVCPVGCITRDSDQAAPTVGANCTACWACYNQCPAGAIAGWMSPAGAARYLGPNADWRALYAPPSAT